MSLPRMRTIAAAHEEIKAIDPNTGISQNQIKILAKSGKIPTIHAGKRMLLNFDLLLDILESEANGTSTTTEEDKQYGNLRRIVE